MPQLADGPPNLRGSPKNTFDRDPLLIPQLFADTKPWYRRRGTLLKVIVSIVLVVLVAVMAQKGIGVTILKKFAGAIPK